MEFGEHFQRLMTSCLLGFATPIPIIIIFSEQSVSVTFIFPSYQLKFLTKSFNSEHFYNMLLKNDFKSNIEIFCF